MKILCGEKTLDLDRMNKIRPDGERVWAEALPFTYEPESLPDPDRGDYFLTSDRGAVSSRDLAFKIMIDLCAWSGANCGKYLLREIARGADHVENGWDTRTVPMNTAMGVLYRDLDLKAVHMPDCSRTLPENLGAFYGPCDLDQAVGGMLSEYVYTDGVPFVKLHQAVSSLLSSFPPEDFVIFIEAIYGVVAHDPETVKKALAKPGRPDAQPGGAGIVEAPETGADHDDGPEQGSDGAGTGSGGSGGENGAAPGAGPGSDAQPDIQDPGSIPPVSDAGTIQVAPDGAVGPDGPSAANGMSVRSFRNGMPLPGGTGLFTTGRKLKGSDLTGTDETFTLEYYAKFYREAIDGADSEGFADQLIKARAGEGSAPITILEEAVTKLRTAMSSKSFGPTGLKEQLMDLALSIRDAAGHLEGLPELAPQPGSDVNKVPAGSEQASEADNTAVGSEQAVEQVSGTDKTSAGSEQVPEAGEVQEEPGEAPAGTADGGPVPEPAPEHRDPASDYDEAPPAPQPAESYDEAPQSGIAGPPSFDDDGDGAGGSEYDPYADLGSGSGDEDGPPDSDFEGDGEP